MATSRAEIESLSEASAFAWVQAAHTRRGCVSYRHTLVVLRCDVTRKCVTSGLVQGRCCAIVRTSRARSYGSSRACRVLTLAKAYRSGAWPLAPVQNGSPSQASLPGRGTVASSVASAVSKLSLRRSHDGAPELTVRYISRISLGVRSGRHRTCFTLVIVPSGISLASCRSRVAVLQGSRQRAQCPQPRGVQVTRT